MSDLFGIDLAQEIANAFDGQLKDGVLHKKAPGTRTSSQLTAGTNPTTVNHAFNGILAFQEVRRSGQLGTEQMAVVTIIGNSVDPFVVPEVNDEVTIESITMTLIELLARDPAAAAYEFVAE